MMMDNVNSNNTQKNALMERVRARTLDHVSQKNQGKTLSEIMSAFNEAAEKHRRQVEENRIMNSDMLPDANGFPMKTRSFAGYAKGIFYGAKYLWTSNFNREQKQFQVSQQVGAFIDGKILSVGGNIDELNQLIETHGFMRDLDSSLSRLKEVLSEATVAATFNNVTPIGTGAKLAQSANVVLIFEKAKEIVQQITTLVDSRPELRDAFPSLEVDGVGHLSALATPFSSEQSEAVEQAKSVIESINEFRKTMNEWDVIEAYQSVWQKRSEICSRLGLYEESEAASKVAEEYDRSHLERLEQAWKM